MFSFKNGTALAIQQDEYIKLYRAGGDLSNKQISDMEQNLWVATASKTAPNNLVVRQWALIDLFKKTPGHKDSIIKMIDLLSYKELGPYRIWAEGYSYFGYTMDILGEWVAKFPGQDTLSVILNKIEEGFVVTSYIRNGVWFPAPFGDLRNEPLKSNSNHPVKNVTISNITFNIDGDTGQIGYSIKGKPLGLNNHIPKDNYTTVIQNGVPAGFKFYEGYDKKYKNSWEEFRDTFDIKRINSIPSCL